MDGKIVIFTQNRYSLWHISTLLMNRKILHTAIFGVMNAEERAKNIELFQNDSHLRVIVMTTRYALSGLTLTAAANVIFFEPCTNITHWTKCLGCVNRVSQKAKSIKVTTLVTANSVEDKFLNDKNRLLELGFI